MEAADRETGHLPRLKTSGREKRGGQQVPKNIFVKKVYKAIS
jgi:hypothetical protein